MCCAEASNQKVLVHPGFFSSIISLKIIWHTQAFITDVRLVFRLDLDILFFFKGTVQNGTQRRNEIVSHSGLNTMSIFLAIEELTLDRIIILL